MSPITTHVLDTSLGQPAEGMVIRLEQETSEEWNALASGVTDSDGRIVDWLPTGSLEIGTYRLVFATGDYFSRLGIEAFYPRVTVEWTLSDSDSHYHVPLLLSPFGYSTYRGS